MLSVMSKDEVIFKLQFQTEMRELRAEQKVFMNCEAGSLLKNVTFEIIDSEGEVDERIHDEDKHGQSHTLAIKCKSFRDAESVKCRFRYGRCTVPSIPLAHTEGVVFFEAMHSRYPELKCVIKVYVEKPRQQHCDSVTNYEDVGNHMHQPKCLSENEAITQSRNSDVLQSKMAAQVSNSALIAQKVHHEKQQKEKLGSTMNQRNLPVSPSPRSSEHQRNLPVSPSSNVSQGMNKTISPHCSGNTILATPSSSKRKQILPISPSSRVSQEMNQTFTPLSSGNPVLSTPRSPEQGMNKTISSHSSGNPMPSTPSSSEHKQILPISPSSRVSQEMNRTFTPPSSGNPVLSTPRSPEQGLLPVSPSLNKTLCLHSSKGFLSPISDSSALKTPKSEHTPALGGTSVILCSKENPSEQELEDDLTNSAKQASSHERNLEIIQSSLLQIQIEISQLQALIDSNPGNNVLHATLEQIQSQSQSAASVICKMPEEELTRQGIVGVASLLGTVESIELSRMLAQYLGEDQMLAIACRNYAAAQSLEVNILHKFAGYNAFCLEDIRPRSKEPSTDPQDPTLRDGNVPHGFLGYAVNLISIAPSHIRWRTTSGHGLRETLFYRLFGELQVYKDRDCMMAAQSCIQTGAVSLDGVILRGNGLISLGLREPKILFSVMRRSTSPEGKLAAKELEVANMQQRMVEEEDAFRRSTQKFLICRDKYNRYMSQKGAE